MESEDLRSFVEVDEDNRLLYMMGSVDSEMAFNVIRGLHLLDSKVGDITIVLHSEGGDETSGYAIYDAVMMCRNGVIIEAYGEVSSIAAAIFQAADIRRLAPNVCFMIHMGTIPVGESAQQNLIVEMADQIRKDNERYYSILASRSKLSYADIEDACKTDTYYNADECLTNGLCDEILMHHKKYKVKKGRKKK